ncbi:MAG TPA: hypothetical protein VF141_05955 [Chryseolinea sp.]
MPTKIVFFCMVFGLSSGQIYAQQKSETAENIDYVAQVEKYRKMKTGGAVLTVVGSVLAVTGMVMVINSMEPDSWDDSTESDVTGGAICVVAGYAALGTGIPLWIVGAVKHKKYSMQLKQLSVKVHAVPQNHGLTFTLRF